MTRRLSSAPQQMLRELRGRHEKAPATLLPAVLRRTGLADRYWAIASPVGTVYVARSKEGIAMVSRAASAAEFERAYRRRHGRVLLPDTGKPPREIVDAIACHGKGGANLTFDLSGLTEFERAVLRKALEIPAGQVRPYGWIAREIGKPGAVRATGSALAKNPVPLLIPCHRVVRTDGELGRYSMGGSRVKRALLAAEGAHPELLVGLANEGVRYLGNEDRRYYCYPSCGGVEDLIRENRIRFRSEREACDAGFTPCEACRPPLAA
jgi:O-6-methylguanine DNA methyltransferase